MTEKPERPFGLGLPRLIKGGKLTACISAHVTREEYDQVQKAAFSEDMTLSDFLRTKLGFKRTTARPMLNQDGPGGSRHE